METLCTLQLTRPPRTSKSGSFRSICPTDCSRLVGQGSAQPGYDDFLGQRIQPLSAYMYMSRPFLFDPHQHHQLNTIVFCVYPLQPRYHAINHATAYGGRETVKVLIALLDEDALAPPCRNKAVLLSADQAVLSGEEGTCMLTLFR